LSTTQQQAVSMFLSYAHEDEDLLRELEAHLSPLKRLGLVSTWYDRQILPSTNWSEEIDEHLEQASIILLLVSSSFIASDYCYEKEMARALERHHAGQARVLPIILRPVDFTGAPFAALQALPTDARPITIWSNRDQAFMDVVAGIRRTIEDLSLLPASAPRAALPKIWNVPYSPNPFFTGRDDLLAQLHTRLISGQTTALTQPPTRLISGQTTALTQPPTRLISGQTTALTQPPSAISGLGGIGKTQLATHYAYRYAQQYSAVLWARAESNDSLTASYSQIAELLKLPERTASEQQITTNAVKTWLQTHRSWLLILDNADDLALLPPFLPAAPTGSILLTTRAWDMGGLAIRLPVEALSDQPGATLLLRRAGLLSPTADLAQATAKDQQAAIQLTQELGGLPLALDQAGAYIEATGNTLETYQKIYQKHRQTLLQERRTLSLDHPDPVATTWSLSFERVEQKNAAAAQLLQLCAYLAPDAIPENIISEGAEYLGPELEPVAADPFLFSQAIEALRAYSLVARDPQTQTISIHRLVQAMVQDRVAVEVGREWKRRVVLAVDAACPDVTDIKQWPACEQWLPHALVCADWIEQEQISNREAAHLLNQAAYYLDHRARYREAEPLYKRALAINEEQMGAEHPDTARSLNNLAGLYETQGKYAETEPLYKRALAIYEEQMGAEHPDTAVSLNNLARLYDTQGKYAEAEPLYKRALRIYEQRLGREHPDTIIILNNVTLFLNAQKRYEDAEPLLRRVLAVRKQRLGGEHLETAESLRNLAEACEHVGKDEEAEVLYKRALSIYEEQLGGKDGYTFRVLNRLANLYTKWGRYREAEPLLKRILMVCEEMLGEEDATTQAVRENYATLIELLEED